MNLDIVIILTIIATAITTIRVVYGFLRNFKTDIKTQIENFKTDINAHTDRIEKRQDAVDERIFFILTGRRLEDAILQEHLNKNQPKIHP